MALSSRRRAPREAAPAGGSDNAADAAAEGASKTRKRARVEEAAAAAPAAAAPAAKAIIADAVAPPLPSTSTTIVAPPVPLPVAQQQRADAAVVKTHQEPPLETAFASTHRDYISARRPGRRIGASAAFAAAAEPLRCSADEVEEARAALSALPPKRANAKAQRRAAIEARFPQWREWMRRGHSVILYGFGSKRAILDKFAASTPASACCGVLVADGGAAGASGRGLALCAARALGVSSRGRNAAATAGGGRAASTALEALAEVDASRGPSRRLLVAVHNIDKMSRDDADAAALARLAACACVRLVATADHANAPLLWDKRATALFAWRWVDATTFAPAAAPDAARAPALLAGGGGVGSGGAGEDGGLSAALAVLGALVPNARAVFCLLAEAQLAALDALRDATGAGGGNSGRGSGLSYLDSCGVPFDHLFRAARERFVAPTEPALRAHLAEFRDHGLLVTRRGGGGAGGGGGGEQPGALQQGGDELAIPLAAEVLARVLDEVVGFG